MALTGNPKHFLNQAGVEYIWRTYIKPQFESLDLSNYPDTHFLANVIEAIDATKADKDEVPNIYFDSTAAWSAQNDVSEENAIYIYTDYYTENGITVQGMKIGDGTNTVNNLPFLDTLCMRHIQNTTIHITADERALWNNHVSTAVNGETAIFYKGVLTTE